MMNNQKNSENYDLQKSYNKLYACIDDEYHRIGINERIEEYNALTDVAFPSDLELTRIHNIKELLEQWVQRKDIDKLYNIYKTLKEQGINVKSPDRFLIGRQR